MQHLEEGTIHAWLDGALSPDESARVERHARECAECAAMVADARGLIAGASRIVSALDVVPGGVIPKQSTTVHGGRSLWRALHLSPFRAALAASVMIAVASLFAAGGNNRMAEQVMVLPAPAPMAATPAAVPPSIPPAPRASEAASARNNDEFRAESKARQEIAQPKAMNALADSARQTADLAKAASVADAQQGQRAAGIPASPVQSQVQSQAPQQMPAPAAAALAEANRVGRSTDSIAPKVSAFGLQRRDAAQEPLRLVAGGLATDPRARRFEGCYQVNADSANWPRSFPSRFALTQAVSTAEVRDRNVVREIDGAGKPDSSAVAGTWRVVAETLANVTWTGGGARMSFSINHGAATPTARAMTGATTQPVRLTQTSCPR